MTIPLHTPIPHHIHMRYALYIKVLLQFINNSTCINSNAYFIQIFILLTKRVQFTIDSKTFVRNLIIYVAVITSEASSLKYRVKAQPGTAGNERNINA